jgi:hypothetical protein
MATLNDFIVVCYALSLVNKSDSDIKSQQTPVKLHYGCYIFTHFK